MQTYQLHMIPEGHVQSTWHYRTKAASREEAVRLYAKQPGRNPRDNSIIQHFNDGKSGIVLCTPVYEHVENMYRAEQPAHGTTVHRVTVRTEPTIEIEQIS